MELIHSQGRNAFFTWKFKKHFTFIEGKGERNITVQCNLCLPGTKLLSASKDSTSNLKKHLERKHQAMYSEFVRKKDVKREACSSGAVHISAPISGASQVTFQSGSDTAKFERGDPRQALISETIAKMIICDLQPVQIVENKGFRELLHLLEPRYVPEPSHYIQQQLLPAYSYQVQLAAKLALSGSESCSLTLDLYRCTRDAVSVDNSPGYLGVTCHFLTTDWQIKTTLLSCLRLSDYRDTQHMLNEFNEICHAHGISGKVFRIVTDSSHHDSHSAFHLPGFYHPGNGDVEGEKAEDGDEEISTGVAGVSGAEEHNPLYQCLGQDRVDCFAHSLSQCIREGLHSSAHISKTLTKTACFYNYVITTVTPEKLRHVFGPGMTGNGQNLSVLGRQWNTQLNTIHQMLESIDFLEDIVDRNDLALNRAEKNLLHELVEVLEPFEEATDMVQGDKHVSISLALPSVLGLRKHLAEVVTHHCPGLVSGLTQALDRRLAGILEDPLYVMATALDPQFKLSWSSDRDWHKQVLLEEVGKHTLPMSPPEPSSEGQPAPSKRSRLFSFIKQRPNMQAKSMEQELSAYLHEEPTDEDPLQYWKRKSVDFPLLSQVARKVFTVPATTTKVERIFSLVRNTLRPEQCRLIPNDLDTLIYLKANYSILWT